MSINWWGIIKNVFKVGIFLAAMYWLSTRISVEELKSGWQKSNVWLLLLALFFYVVSQIIAASRLNSFFATSGIKLTERYNLRLYQLGLLYNYFIPGGIGGDAYKIYLLKKNFGYSRKKLLTAIFFDRLSGLWAMGIIVGGLIIFMPRLGIPNWLTATAMIAGTTGYFYILRLYFRPLTKNFLTTHSKALLVQGFQALTVITLLYALDFNGKFSPHILVFLTSSIVAIVPSFFGAVGLREATVEFLSVYLQIDQHLGVLITILFNFISILVASTGAYYILRPQGLGADKLPSAKEVEQELAQEEDE